MARVKFIRDGEPNIKALPAAGKVIDGAIYVATDTGTMWLGTSGTSLLQIMGGNIDTNTTYTLTKKNGVITLTGSDGSVMTVYDDNTVYNDVESDGTESGLMTPEDKAKLDSIEEGATKTAVDSALSSTSTNPVQNKTVKAALDGKASTSHSHSNYYDANTSRTANTVLAAPNESAGGATFRKLVAADIPTLTKSKISDFPTSLPASDVADWAKAESKPTYTASEVGAAAANHTHDDRYYTESEMDTKLAAKVPTTRTINKKALSADITLSASDVGAAASSHTHAKADITDFPTSMKNPSALTISLNGTSQGAYDGSAAKSFNITPSSIGAATSGHTHTKANITDFPTSMPASDVSAWAKAASKPGYNFSEISGTVDVTKQLSGTIPSANLPSYVDDVIEGYYNGGKFYKTVSDGTYSNEITGEAGKIYTDLLTNKIYRWGGTAYAVISDTLALGETSSTAYRGDRGKIAYDHSQKTGNPHGTTKSDLGLGNVENKSSATIRGELTKANVTAALGYTPPTSDTNTHYASKNVVGSSTSTANTTTALTNGNVYLNSVENGAVTSAHKISGSGATTVTTDTSGNIIISSTDTNTNTTYNTGTTSTAGLTKLYTSTGSATDGTMTQEAITTALNGKAASSHSHSISQITNLQTNLDGKLPLSGGTMTGKITGTKGGSNISARDNVTVNNTNTADAGNAWSGFGGQKTTKGHWAVGNLSGSENLSFHYTTDIDYSAGTNNSTDIQLPPTAGTIALTSQIPSVGNGTVTIKQGGTTKGSFSMNQSGATTIELTDNNTTYSNFVKSGSGAKAGLVPAPSTTAGTTKYLREDGTWTTPPNSNTTYSAGTGLSLSGTTFSVKTDYTTSGKNYKVSADDSGNLYVNVPWTDTNTVYTHPTSSGNKHIPSGGSSGQILRWSADGTAAWGSDNNTWIAFKGATTDAAGTAGYAPAPAAGAANRYLCSDGTWQVPPNTNTWTALKGATGTSAGTAGYAPAPAAGYGSYFLRGDATWAPISKSTVGLGNVDNTADANKSVNYAASAGTASALGTSSVGSSTKPVYLSNGVPTACSYTLGKSVPSTAVFTDTHYTSKNIVGSSTATSNTTSSLSNGNVYLRHIENGSATSTHKISGSGATSVTTDSSGNIVISSTDTNTNTTYSAGTGISLSGTTFSNSGVRSISSGSSNGTISVNTGGSTTNVSVKGLGTAAYTSSSSYASASHTHSGYAASDIVTVSSTQPTSSTCLLWVKI